MTTQDRTADLQALLPLTALEVVGREPLPHPDLLARRRPDGIYARRQGCLRRGRPGWRAARSVALQHSLDAQQELAHAERLADVVVGALLEAGDAVVFTRPRGHHDDGNIARSRVGSK